MNLKLQKIQRWLRDTHLLAPVERVRYLFSVIRLHRQNRRFIADNPHFALPPAALAYDAYSAPDWNFYAQSGKDTAEFLAKTIKKYSPRAATLRILEWGCGPARVIRHLAAAFVTPVEAFGSDYNEQSIAWCSRTIPGVAFIQNELHPPLKVADNFIDAVYSISVFTHLSDNVSKQWIAELLRILRPGGLAVITTNGDSHVQFMLPDEMETYAKQGVVIRGNFEEGKKMFWACHAPQYLRQTLFRDFEVLEHAPASFPYNNQDCWILRKAT